MSVDIPAAVMRMRGDFLDSLLMVCEPPTANNFGGANTAYTLTSITTPSSNVVSSISPSTKTVSDPILEMKLERAPFPDSATSRKALKVVTLGGGGASPTDGGPPPTKKRKQDREDRRDRKNHREKQRRTELNALYDNMMDLLGLPKETKADKATVLASAISTIRQLRSAIRPELLQLVQERNFFNVPVSETCAAAQQAVQMHREAQRHGVSIRHVAAQPPAIAASAGASIRHVAAQPPAIAASASVNDLTYFDPNLIFADNL